MTRDEITRIAQEDGIVVTGEAVWRLCELVAAAERQRIEDLLMEQHEMAKDRHNYWKVAAEWVRVGTDEEICK